MQLCSTHLFPSSYHFYCLFSLGAQVTVSSMVLNLLYDHVNESWYLCSLIAFHCYPTFLDMVVIVMVSSCNQVKPNHIAGWISYSYTSHVSFDVSASSEASESWIDCMKSKIYDMVCILAVFLPINFFGSGLIRLCSPLHVSLTSWRYGSSLEHNLAQDSCS